MKPIFFWKKSPVIPSSSPPDYWDEIGVETTNESTAKSRNWKLARSFKFPVSCIPSKLSVIEFGRPVPFVGLRGRLSQVWASQWVIVLILMTIKLVLFKNSLANSIENAQIYAEKTASNANDLIEKTALVPQYMAQTANTLIVKSIDHTIESLTNDLIMIITGLEEIIFFMLEMLVGTYACLSLVLVDATANAAINATEKVISFANTTAIAAETAINKSVQKLDEAFTELRNLVNMVDTFFSGGQNEIRDVSTTVNSTFASWSIPSSINTDLENLRSHIPTYDDVKNETRKLIELPFKELKKDLNATLHSNDLGIDPSLLPVPQAARQSTLIEPEQVQNIYLEFYHVLNITFIVIIVLSAVAICAMIFYEAYRQVSRWRWIQMCADNISQLGLSEDNKQDQQIHNILRAESHLKYRIYDSITKKIYPDSRLKHTLLLWNIEYMTTPTNLTLLGLAVAGIILVGIQFLILRLLQNAIPHLEKNLSELTRDVTLDFQQQAQYWSISTNFAIDKAQSNVNDNVLGWVRTGSTAINSTLNGFMDHMNSALNTAFGQTPLNNVVSGVIGCVFGNKVAQLQKGLTWANDHAKVNFPHIDSSLIDPTSQNRSQPALLQHAKQDVVFFMKHTIGYYEKSLLLELYVAIAMLAVWLFFLVASLLYNRQAYAKFNNDTSSIENLDKLVNPDPPPKTDYFTRNSAPRDLRAPVKPLFHQRSYSDTAASPTPLSIGRDWQYDPDNPPDFLLSDPFKSLYSEGPMSSHASTFHASAFHDNGPPTPIVLRPKKAKLVSIKIPSFYRQSFNGDIDGGKGTWKRY